jgi:hypothetical protein
MCDALARADLSGLSGSAMPPDVHEGSGAAPWCVVGSNVPSGAPNRPSSAIRRVLWAATADIGVCALCLRSLQIRLPCELQHLRPEGGEHGLVRSRASGLSVTAALDRAPCAIISRSELPNPNPLSGPWAVHLMHSTAVPAQPPPDVGRRSQHYQCLWGSFSARRRTGHGSARLVFQMPPPGPFTRHPP